MRKARASSPITGRQLGIVIALHSCLLTSAKLAFAEGQQSGLGITVENYMKMDRKRIGASLDCLARLADVPAYDFAIIHTALGENEQALAWLQRAYNEHDWALVVLGVEPRLDPLRSDSRFRSLLRKVGLKQP